MRKLLYIVGIIAVLLIVSEASKRRRFRGKKTKTSCHFSELDKCMEKVSNYAKNANSSQLLTTSKGLDEICTNSFDSVECIVQYINNCGTGLHQELYDLASGQFSKSVDYFCKSPDLRNELLAHSPCIHERFLMQTQYRRKCIHPFLATVDTTSQVDDSDQRLDIVCCSYLRWKQCMEGLLTKTCGREATVALNHLVNEALAGFMDLVCNETGFNHKSKKCNDLYAPPGSVPKGDLSENPITRYLLLYFGFLVN